MKITEHEMLVTLANMALEMNDLTGEDVLDALKQLGYGGVVEEARDLESPPEKELSPENKKLRDFLDENVTTSQFTYEWTPNGHRMKSNPSTEAMARTLAGPAADAPLYEEQLASAEAFAAALAARGFAVIPKPDADQRISFWAGREENPPGMFSPGEARESRRGPDQMMFCIPVKSGGTVELRERKDGSIELYAGTVLGPPSLHGSAVYPTCAELWALRNAIDDFLKSHPDIGMQIRYAEGIKLLRSVKGIERAFLCLDGDYPSYPTICLIVADDANREVLRGMETRILKAFAAVNVCLSPSIESISKDAVRLF